MLALMAQNVLRKVPVALASRQNHPVTGEISGVLRLNDERSSDACLYLREDFAAAARPDRTHRQEAARPGGRDPRPFRRGAGQARGKTGRPPEAEGLTNQPQ